MPLHQGSASPPCGSFRIITTGEITPTRFCDLPRQTRQKKIASALLFLCGMIPCFDVGGELHGVVLYPRSFNWRAKALLGTELLATPGLGFAFVRTRAEIRRTFANSRDDKDRLRAPRDEFDQLMHQRFRGRGPSPAESDVTLLTMRGLKIADIARMRGALQGTVKSQLSTIFRKSGTSTRTEFDARFIDEFLDPSATPV